MKNILINIISLNSERPRCKTYAVGEESVDAYQTNEACFRCVETMLEQNNERVDMVVSLVSKEARELLKFYERNSNWEKCDNPNPTLSNYVFFKNAVSAYFRNKDIDNASFKEIQITDANRNENENFTKYVTEVFAFVEDYSKKHCSNEKPRIILDVAGGKRDISNLLQLITKIFQYHGYEVASYYTEEISNTDNGRFCNCNEVYHQLEVLDIVNDFIQGGNVFHFYEFFKDSKVENIRKLANSLLEFNQAMLLCSIDDIYKSIDRIKSIIDSINRLQDTHPDIRTLKMMTGLLRKKFHLHKRDTPKKDLGVVEWCLDNRMYQQAVTICYERIPVFLVENKLITFPDNGKADKDTAVDILEDYVNKKRLPKDGLNEQDKELVEAYHNVYSIRNKLNHAGKRDVFKVNNDSITKALKDFLQKAEKAFDKK